MRQILNKLGTFFLNRSEKEIGTGIAFILLLLLFGFSNFTRTTSYPKQPTDLQSLLHGLSSPVYGAQVDYFLKIDGIDGESIDQNHPNEIQINSFSWGDLSQGTQANGGGGGAGKVRLNDFHITKTVDKASPKLFLFCANGNHIPKAVLSVSRSEKLQDFLKITYTDLLCSSYKQEGSAQNLIPLDSISFTFSKIDIEYRQQNANGILGPTVSASWNFSNK